MYNEIELKDLLGHSESVIQSAEETFAHEKRDGFVESGYRRTSLTRINLYFALWVLVVFLGIIFFVIDKVYLSHSVFEHHEKYDDEVNSYDSRKSPKPKESKIETSKTTNNETDDKNSNDQMTIVNGIDDKDVYCEDLTQYEEWHRIKITINDGIMYQVVNQMDHDKESFTQGLTYARGKLFESAGLYGKSSVRILDRDSGQVKRKVSMESKFFAEGITYYKDTLVQITWKSRRGFIYNVTNLEEIDSFYFKTTVNQGWGITWDRCNDELIVTDGSPNLHFWDPISMTEIRRVKVTRMDGKDANEMNEIEYWRGRVLANVWYEDVVLVINPETGAVEKEYDFSRLWPKSQRRSHGADVLNGISISEYPNILYFTGKKWDRMYEIRLLPEI